MDVNVVDIASFYGGGHDMLTDCKLHLMYVQCEHNGIPLEL